MDPVLAEFIADTTSWSFLTLLLTVVVDARLNSDDPYYSLTTIGLYVLSFLWLSSLLGSCLAAFLLTAFKFDLVPLFRGR